MNMAIDRVGIARDIYHDTGRAEYGMLSPGTYAYDPNFKSYAYDPAARQEVAGRSRLSERLHHGLRACPNTAPASWSRPGYSVT